MTLSRINPESLGFPRGYSNGILCPPGGHLLFIAGQIAWDSQQQMVGDGSFPLQFGQALHNVLEVVRAAGGGPEHLTALTIFVTDKQKYLESLKEVGGQWKRVAGTPYPSMALVEVKSLLEPRALVEIQGIACLPSPSSIQDTP